MAFSVSAPIVAPGMEFRAAYPFVRATFSHADEDGYADVPTWNPGIRFETSGPYGEDVEAKADGEGWVVYSVVDVHKPPHPYPARVFYTRRFVRPNGGEFGRGKLHITTLDAFRRRTRGFFHPYTVAVSA